jgi:hypothetical protein
MATDAPATPSSTPNRPRPLLLVLLGLTLLVALWMNFGGSGDSGARPPVAARPSQRGDGAAGQKLDPAELDVRLEALAGERPAPGGTERDPFRFKPKPAPPPPPLPTVKPAPGPQGAGGPVVPPTPAPPPITVKFIGTLELPDGAMVAIFTDCTVGRRSTPVREGGTILGQYRLVKIGLQSVVVEHLDGRGRTTLPKTGQECVK